MCADIGQRAVADTPAVANPDKSATLKHYQAQARIALMELAMSVLDDKRTYIEVGNVAIAYLEKPETDPALEFEPAGWVLMYRDRNPTPGTNRDVRYDTFVEALTAAIHASKGHLPDTPRQEAAVQPAPARGGARLWSFQQICDLLPASVMWGDNLTLEIVVEILSRALQRQLKEPQ